MATIIEGVSHLDADELEGILRNPNSDTIIIDVREHEEYIEGHIPGVPLFSMGNIPDAIDSFDTTREYVFVCRSGARSLNVAKYFQNAGIENVHNYVGGMLAWDKEVAFGEEHIIEDFSMAALIRKS